MPSFYRPSVKICNYSTKNFEQVRLLFKFTCHILAVTYDYQLINTPSLPRTRGSSLTSKTVKQ